jgi:adenylosuccinate lyase
MIKAISPIDGRYSGKTEDLQQFFSEWALIKYRVLVEVEYLIELSEYGLPQIQLTDDQKLQIRNIFETFSIADAEKIKTIEKTTNHDVKAVEYFIKEKVEALGLGNILEFIHFALTSQDINNTVLPLQIRDANQNALIPALNGLTDELRSMADQWITVPMLARTHGQPASPTTIGKELMVFVERLEYQTAALESIKLRAKFGGATGQFNAHVATYPSYDWPQFANSFIERLGLKRAQWTTQIAHYDDHAEVFHAWSRINTILKDLCMDIWTYVSLNYFSQKTIAGEVGSSAMPHKVNPIDFENAEGNLGLAIAIFEFLARKLPISRMQRDLTDSTVSRNIGVPYAHTMIAISSIKKGLSKLILNETQLHDDLENNWAVVAEAIQNILRREGYPKPYEALKALTRGQDNITKTTLHNFIETLTISNEVKNEMLTITPQNYIGILRRS